MGKWKLSLVLLFISLVGVSSFLPSVDARIFFPSIEYRLSGPPTYCGVDLGDRLIPENKINHWLDLVKESVSEWKTKLQNFDSYNKQVWEMNYKLIPRGESYYTSYCDIPVFFKSHSADQRDKFETGGRFLPEGRIEIFYLEPVWCETFREDYFVKCFEEGKFASDATLTDVIQHEIGHSLSLGHYTSDNNEQNEKWSSGFNLAPSIMIPTLHQNPSLQEITEVDVRKVFQVYGSDGFYAFSPRSPPTGPFIPPTPEPTPIPIPKAPIVPVFPFERIEITQEIIEVEKYAPRQFVRIVGEVSDDVFKQGFLVVLIIKNPDLTTETLTFSPTRKGHFEVTLAFDGSSQRGTYSVQASYLEHHDRNMDFSFSVVDKGTVPTQLIPKFNEPPSSLDEGSKEAATLKKHEAKNVLDDLKSRISQVEKDLSGVTYEDALAQEKIEKAWNLRWTILKSLEKADTKWGAGEYELDKGNFKTARNIFEDLKSDNESIENIFDLISSEIYDAKKMGGPLVPEWIKNNARWWAEGKIGESDFVGGIQYMIKENIMVIPDLPEDTQMELKDEKRAMGLERDVNVPDWVRNNAGWWAEGLISDDDFVSGIKYLVEQGIIRV